jgi:hypothetical protein
MRSGRWLGDALVLDAGSSFRVRNKAAGQVAAGVTWQ